LLLEPTRRKMKKTQSSTIQRLVIFHKGFACRDESAILEELSDYILYYYNVKYHISSGLSSNTCNRDLWSSVIGENNAVNDLLEEKAEILREAIQFTGMCETFQGFTENVGSSSLIAENANKKSKDETKRHAVDEVHLSNSTLIFIPLENQCFAVAEVYRRASKEHCNFVVNNPCSFCNNKNLTNLDKNESIELSATRESPIHHPLCTNSNSFVALGGDSQSIGETIKKCHILFCLVTGKGGILHRIGRSQNQFDDRDKSPNVQKMLKIIDLRKKLRKTRAKLDSLLPETLHSNDLNGDKEGKVLDLQKLLNRKSELECTISDSIPNLPISILRKELQFHYDNVLRYLLFPAACDKKRSTSEYEKRASNDLDGGGGLIPSKHAEIDITGNLVIGRLMDDMITQFHSEGLVAMSSFYKGKLLWTRTRNKDEGLACSAKYEKTFLFREEILLLYKYIINNRGSKMINDATKSKSILNKAMDASLFSLPAGFINTSEHINSTKAAKSLMQASFNPYSGYLAPSMGQSNRTHDCITLENDSFIWLLDVNTLFDDNGDRIGFISDYSNDHLARKQQGYITEYKAIVYQCRSFYFILYFEVEALLHLIETKATTLTPWKVASLIDNEDTSESSTQEDGPSISLFSQMSECIHKKIDAYEEKRLLQYQRHQHEYIIKNMNKYGGEEGLDIIFRDNCEHNVAIYTRNINLKENMNQFQSLSWNHNDYPRFLSSTLSHNVILALDETFSEIKTTETDFENMAFPVRELCTFLPQKWVYGVSQNQKELVIIFDATRFATFADVQKAACRVRNRILTY